ncbi:MAG: hypothetical protein ABI242_11765 [Caulobacteraceae bacterium]
MNQIQAAGSFERIAEDVARGLSKASMLGGRAFIRTPVLFPSGSTVVVVIHEEGGGRFRVSDLGQGSEEADTLGIAASFRTQAAEIAARSGIEFDDHAFIVTALGRDQLVGAVMAVANASGRALERAMLRTERGREAASVRRLVAKLERVFPEADVIREAELRGVSDTAWRVDALVRADEGQAAFDFVTPHPNSVTFATAKFLDISRLENPPLRVAVVHRKASLGDLLTVLAHVARVVEEDAPDATFARALAA